MDPRLRAAVEASASWYDDVFAVHGVPVSVRDGLWAALGPPPAWHSAVRSLVPDRGADAVLQAMEPHEHGSVADSFGDLDLAPHGFDLLFAATWVHRPPTGSSAVPGALPPGWSVLTDPATFEEWNEHHETTGVLLPSLLSHPRFTFLARHEGEVLTSGAVTHTGTPVVGLSNCWSVPGRELDWLEVAACVDALHPGRAAVDFAWGEDLDAMYQVGFGALGPHRVWVR